MPEATHTIGQLAAAAGVNVETIRYYQRRGLLPEPPRPAGGSRRYSPAVLDDLRFILRAKRLGFSLAEIGELLALEGNDLDTRRRLAVAKLELIHEHIAELESMAAALGQIIDACHAPAGECNCPLRVSSGRE